MCMTEEGSVHTCISSLISQILSLHHPAMPQMPKHATPVLLSYTQIRSNGGSTGAGMPNIHIPLVIASQIRFDGGSMGARMANIHISGSSSPNCQSWPTPTTLLYLHTLQIRFDGGSTDAGMANIHIPLVLTYIADSL